MSAEVKSLKGRRETGGTSDTHLAVTSDETLLPSSNKIEATRLEASGTSAARTPPVIEQVPHQTQHSSHNWLRWGGWLMQIALAIGGGYWLALSLGQEEHRVDLTALPTPKSVDKTVPVTVHKVERKEIERAIEAVGNLHGYDELTVKTKVSGRVARIAHEFADRVAPGELLLEIDPVDAQLAVEQSKRSLSSELAKWGFEKVPDAKTDLTSLPTVVASRLKAEWTRSQLSRLIALQNRGSVSTEELEQARTNSLVADSEYSNQLQLARAGAATAQLKKAELDIAEQHLTETRVFVPKRDASALAAGMKYTITERFVSEGAWLAAGTDLFRMVIDDTLKLRLTIPEKYAASVQIGQRVEVLTLASSQPVIGAVTRISPAVDPQTRTFQLEAEVPNQAGHLKTGGFAKARVIIDAASSAQIVPVTALVSFAGVHKVFIVQGDEVHEVQVKLGEQTPEWIEIVEPTLPTDALVVTSGQSQLADGSLIRVRTAEELAAASQSGSDRSSAAGRAASSNAPASAASALPGATNETQPVTAAPATAASGVAK